MTEEGTQNPIAEIVGSFVRSWLTIRGIDRTANLAIARHTTYSISLASSWLGISWGLFVAYTVGQESIDVGLFAMTIFLLVASNLSFLYFIPKMLDSFSKEITKASDDAIAVVLSHEFPGGPSSSMSPTHVPLEAPSPENKPPPKNP